MWQMGRQDSTVDEARLVTASPASPAIEVGRCKLDPGLKATGFQNFVCEKR